MATSRTWLVACAALLLVGGRAPARTGPATDTPPRIRMVEADTPVLAGPVSAGPPGFALRRPDVDLAPPPPVPLVQITRTSGDSPGDYFLEIDQDGTVRYEGHYNVCVQGEATKEVPSAIVERARELVRRSRVFDRRFEQCYGRATDDGEFEIYFADPPPGSMVRASDTCPQRRFVTNVATLARALEKLVDATPWIERKGRASCRPSSFWRSIW